MEFLFKKKSTGGITDDTDFIDPKMEEELGLLTENTKEPREVPVFGMKEFNACGAATEDILGDGRILKKIIKEGVGELVETSSRVKCECCFWLEGFFLIFLAFFFLVSIIIIYCTSDFCFLVEMMYQS